MKRLVPYQHRRIEWKIARKSKKRRKWKKNQNRIRYSREKHKYRRPRNGEPRHDNGRDGIIQVPTQFSLISNHEEVLKFFNECKKLYKSRHKDVHFDFRQVDHIGNGSITILLSIIGGLKDQGKQVSGNYPENPSAREFFERSGFLRYFRTKSKKGNSDSRNAILQRGRDQIQANATAKLIHDAMKTVWGEDYRNLRLQGMLVELMANTVNHAFNANSHQKGWYFSVDHIEKENKVKFCFVDNGKGIIKTIRIRFNDKIKLIFNEIDDGNLLAEAFNGKFGSRTRKFNRGKGLPLIKRNWENNVIKKLKVISNNVILDFETGQTSLLKEGFAGTFYYWELDTNCELWKLK